MQGASLFAVSVYYVNFYDLSPVLLSEYQTAAKSVVDVAQAQADEDYRAYQSWLANTQYTAEWNRRSQLQVAAHEKK